MKDAGQTTHGTRGFGDLMHRDLHDINAVPYRESGGLGIASRHDNLTRR